MTLCRYIFMVALFMLMDLLSDLVVRMSQVPNYLTAVCSLPSLLCVHLVALMQLLCS